MENVYIARCKDYQYENVEKSVYECLDGINGIKGKIKQGSKVLLKVNLLKKNNPEDAVTTHPAVARAVVGYLQKMGAKVVIGDSPGGPYNEKILRSIYKATGMMEVAEETGCELNYDTSAVEVVNEKAVCLKNMQVIKVTQDVDFVISAAKLKTHGMMIYTGAVKNLFGVIPGLIKVDYHMKMNSAEKFAEHLVDICEYIKPVFSIIDAIDGMEGDGPSSGEKRHAGLVIASASPYAADMAAVQIMGMKASDIPTIREAVKRNLCCNGIDAVRVDGVQLKDINLPPFKLPRSSNVNMVGNLMPKFMENWVLSNVRPKPEFDHNICISCGDCRRSCPPKAIEMKSGKPVVNLDSCIRCFCCHELCPKKAIEIRRHWLHKALFK